MKRRMGPRLALGVAVLVLLPALVAGAVTLRNQGEGAPSAGAISRFAGPGISDPTGIVTGPDGNLWFTNAGNNSIGRITPAGVVTNFADASILSPLHITVGPDGALWFTNWGNNSIGRITTAGAVTNFTDPSMTNPWDITSGPDGALWFTNDDRGRGAQSSIGRITTAGAVTSFTDRSIIFPKGITVGPDGALWFVNSALSTVDRITTAGAVTQVVSFFGTGPGHPVGITSAPDGGLWVAFDRGALRRVSTAGSVTDAPNIGDGNSSPAITVGPDGAIWGVSYDGTVTRVTTAGVRSTFSDPSVRAPAGITTGPDGALWFTNGDNDTIGRITTSGGITSFRGTGNGIDKPTDVALGTDGALWFTNNGNDTIGRITTAGDVTNFAGAGISLPAGITTGPDGALWFTNNGNDTIGRITTSGAITTVASAARPESIAVGADGGLWYTTPTAIGRVTTDGQSNTYGGAGIQRPLGIALGVDGNVWFGNADGASIGRITPAGVVSSFTDAAIGRPTSIAAGPDGALWFTAAALNGHAAAIGRVTTSGTFTLFPSGTVNDPVDITPGPDGALWFTDIGSNTVGRITTTGVMTSYPGGGTNFPMGITAGPDGGLWFANNGGSIGRVQAGAPGSGPGASFHPLAPGRALDSRTSLGGWGSPLPAGSDAAGSLLIAGAGEVPLTATAVVANITVTDGTAGSFLSVYPTGWPAPTSSAINFAPGETIANQVTVPVGAGGRWSFRGAAGTVHVIVDVVGYYDAAPGDGFTAQDPARILDSRTPTGGWGTPLAAGGAPRTLATAGVGGVPSDAVAVVMNLTVTGSSTGSFLTAWPAGQSPPSASTINFGAGETIANSITVKVGAGGAIAFANALGAVDVIVDITGYYRSGGGDVFHALAPTRLLDSRDPAGPWHAPLDAGAANGRALVVRGGATGIPDAASAVLTNVTVTNSSAGSFLTVFPTGSPLPTASTINFGRFQTIANGPTARVGSGGAVSFVNAVGSVDVVVDATGWFAAT